MHGVAKLSTWVFGCGAGYTLYYTMDRNYDVKVRSEDYASHLSTVINNYLAVSPLFQVITLQRTPLDVIAEIQNWNGQ